MQVIYEPRGRAREYAALACNLYRGCVNGCTYCYAPACLRMQRDAFHAASVPRANIIANMRKDLRAPTPDPVLFCFTSDPYPPDSLITREALSVMREHGRAFHVLTKGGTRAARDFDLYGPHDEFGQTIVFIDDRLRCEWEPGAAPIADRIKTLRIASAYGIRTWVSLEPVIDAEQAVAVVEQLSPWVDHWKIGKANYTDVSVDWTAFSERIGSVLRDLGASYYVKESLRPYWNGSGFPVYIA